MKEKNECEKSPTGKHEWIGDQYTPKGSDVPIRYIRNFEICKYCMGSFNSETREKAQGGSGDHC